MTHQTKDQIKVTRITSAAESIAVSNVSDIMKNTKNGLKGGELGEHLLLVLRSGLKYQISTRSSFMALEDFQQRCYYTLYRQSNRPCQEDKINL